MNSQIAIEIQERDKIYYAAYWHTESDDELTVIAENALNSLLRQRKEAAIRYLETSDSEQRIAIKLFIDHINNTIKIILAI